MKKFVALVAVVALVAFVAPAFAGCGNWIPENGEYEKEDWSPVFPEGHSLAGPMNFVGEGEFQIYVSDRNVNVYWRPLQWQFSKDCPAELRLVEPTQWQAYASVAVWEGDEWVLMAEKDYRQWTFKDEEVVKAALRLPETGEIFWFRVWADEHHSSRPIVLQKDSPWGREAKSGWGVEFLVNVTTGEVSPVPKDYPQRP